MKRPQSEITGLPLQKTATKLPSDEGGDDRVELGSSLIKMGRQLKVKNILYSNVQNLLF